MTLIPLAGAGADDWFGTDASTLLSVAASAVAIYLAIILMVRVSGLRSFSQLSAFDFAMTVSMGTILATTAISSDVSLPEGLIAAAAFFSIHALISMLRRRANAGALVDNTAKLVARDGELIDGRLDEVGMTEADLAAKLRAAGIRSLDEVAAVVMETTGDVSVVSREHPGQRISDDLLHGVDRG